MDKREDVLRLWSDCKNVITITNAGSYGAVLPPMQLSMQGRLVELFVVKNGAVSVL